MASNKHSAGFFLFVLVLIGLFLGWLMLFQPQPEMKTVETEVPHERVLP